MKRSFNVGILGCGGTGHIYNAYIQNCKYFDILNPIACSSKNLTRAQKIL